MRHLFNQAVRMRRNRQMKLPLAYQENSRPEYFFDAVETNETWQPDVYPYVDHLASRWQSETAIDIGCSNAKKLSALGSVVNRIGVDYGGNLALARAVDPSVKLIDWDLELSETDKNLGVEGSIVVMSDVIEHLRDPRKIVSTLSRWKQHVDAIVISTPDRNLARGRGTSVPPSNPAHVREWSLDEFAELLRQSRLEPIIHGYTRNYSAADTRNTQVAVIPGGHGWGLSTSLPSVLAMVPCFNEKDIIVHTVEALLNQGFSTYIVDDWSTDGSWELLNETYRRNSNVRLVRSPFGPGSQYQWQKLLNFMDQIAARSDFDWILRVDADERVESSIDGKTLRQVMQLADQNSFDVIDFTLLDFRYTGEVAPSLTGWPDYWEFARRPGARHLERVWRNRGDLVGLDAFGGHRLAVAKRIFPFNMVLKHYPLRGPEHARKKVFQERLPRTSDERADLGWHTQYQNFRINDSFIWDHRRLERWSPTTCRDWVLEISGRVGIPFDS